MGVRRGKKIHVKQEIIDLSDEDEIEDETDELVDTTEEDISVKTEAVREDGNKYITDDLKPIGRNSTRKLATTSREPEINQIHLPSSIPSSLKRKRSDLHTFKTPRVPPTIHTDKYQQWIDKYEPKSSSEICINPQKLKQVREQLSLMISGTDPTKLLILTGPSGSSKSTTIKILANELINRSQALALDSQEKFIEYNDSTVEGTNQSDQFEEFINDAKYKIGSNLSVILVEELPNIFHSGTLAKFRNCIRNWIYSNLKLPPLVLCLTEIEYSGENREYSFNIENNLTVDTLLGRELVNSAPVKVIKFNSIANRYLRKTINGIISVEKETFRKIPNMEINRFLDEMVRIGDVRSLIFNMQLWGQHWHLEAGRKVLKEPSNETSNEPSNETSNEPINEPTREPINPTREPINPTREPCVATNSTLQHNLPPIDSSKFIGLNYQRENQIGLFHAIGKIIYSSSEFDTLSTQDQDYFSIERVLMTFNNNNFSLLNLSILENYSIYQDAAYPIEVASKIVDDLSINDLFSNFEANREIGIRSTRLNLRSVNARLGISHKSKIKFPRHFKMVRHYNKTYTQIKNYQKYVNNLQDSFDELNLVDGYYLPLIYNKQKNNRYRYNRLGGRFHEIYADEELPIIEGDENTSGATDENVYEMDQFQMDIISKMSENNDVEEEDELSDPIDDSDDGDDGDSDGFLSDPELDILISQGRI